MAMRQDQMNEFLKNLELKSKSIYDAFLASAESITSTVTLNALADAFARGDVEQVLEILGLSQSAFGVVDEAIREAFMLGAASSTAGLRPNSFGAKILGRFSVRNSVAELYLTTTGAERVSGYLQEMRGVIQDTLVSGMQRGSNPLKVARELVGVLKKGEAYRKGGTLFLTRPRAATVANVRWAFAEGDLVGMKNYLTLSNRDRRFDSIVRAAILSKKSIGAEKSEQILNYLTDNYLKERAKAIARTEALASLNAGKAEAFRQATATAGIDDRHVHREWSSTGDKKVRPDHQHLDGQKVIGINTPYRLPSGAPIMRPGDFKAGAKQVVHCRCMEYLEVDWFEGRA